MSRERHGDGSYTDRYQGHQSVTRNSDGSVRESSRPETSKPVPRGFAKADMQVGRNSRGEVTNRQRRG